MTGKPPSTRASVTALVAASAVLLLSGSVPAGEEKRPTREAPTPGSTPPPVAEATVRARLLHAAFSGSLQVMHRDFFRKGNGKAIPSESLRDVFKSLGDEHGVTLRWLATSETVMNRDNLATDAFGKQALQSITGGEKEFSAVENGTLRFAGAITLQNECLKCHVPDRKSLEDRFAALEISMPVTVPPRDSTGKAP